MTTYDRCPCCGCNVPILAGDEGTNSFKIIDIEKIQEILDNMGHGADCPRLRSTRKECTCGFINLIKLVEGE